MMNALLSYSERVTFGQVVAFALLMKTPPHPTLEELMADLNDETRAHLKKYSERAMWAFFKHMFATSVFGWIAAIVMPVVILAVVSFWSPSPLAGRLQRSSADC